jgi:monoamine oxidase
MVVTETIIIGGGLSGLYTAFKLHQAHLPYLLLEAKSDVGGRIAGHPALPDSDLSVDMGPTWFWPHQSRLQELLTYLEIQWFEQFTDGNLLYQMNPEEVVTRSSAGRAETMTSYRVKGGMQKLVRGLTKQLKQSALKNEHAVASIKKHNDTWQITAVHREKEHIFAANQLVLALPPRMIVKHLTPEHYLSRELINELQVQQTWMSGQAKFVALYDKPFWREKGFAGQAFSQVGPMVEIHDGSSAPDSGYALFGFIGLQPHLRSQHSGTQLKSQCLAQLGQIFGPDALAAEACYLKDWARDEWVATDQDVKESPRHATFTIGRHQKELESLGLHLAASEFARNEPGYLEGALEAADSAVDSKVNRANTIYRP